MPPPRVGLDIGDVLSSRNVPGAEGQNIYKAAMHGAYAFCVFFLIRHGPENFFIISRTNEGRWHTSHRGQEIEAWVVRFARSLGVFVNGVPTQNMHICTSRSGADGKSPTPGTAG